MSRRVAREKALQALYQSDVRGEEEEGVQSLAEEVSERERPFFWRLVRGVWEKRQVIDPVIGQHLKKGWSLSRLAVVDRSICAWRCMNCFLSRRFRTASPSTRRSSWPRPR